MRRIIHAALLLWLPALAACGDAGPGLVLASPDQTTFQQNVYPVLLRDCGFPDCHGDPRRFFRVFGPGRQRVSPTLAPLDPATPDEVTLAYERARSMLDAEAPLDSLLLNKPLDPAAGGAGHQGIDDFGRDVYESTTDPAWVVLRDWALSASRTPPPAPASTDSPTTHNPGAAP